MIIGVDVDGVLAHFNEGYARALTAVSGKSLVPAADLTWQTAANMPPTWFWPQVYGYTDADDKAAWKAIAESPDFWATLKPLPGAVEALARLKIDLREHEVYFITNRLGVDPKGQTEDWLERHGYMNPTVLIARGDKGGIARGLGLTHFVDDRPLNLFSARDASPATACTLVDCRYNQWAHGECRDRKISIVASVKHYFEQL